MAWISPDHEKSVGAGVECSHGTRRAFISSSFERQGKFARHFFWSCLHHGSIHGIVTSQHKNREDFPSAVRGENSLIPQIETCLICDLVRPELGGKLSVLGFYGVCPHVEVALQRLDLPVVLTFLCMGGMGDGTFSLTFEVIDDTERVIASSAAQPFNADLKSATVLATTLILVFGRVGQFAGRCVIDGVERFRGYFRIGQAAAS